MGWAFTFCSSAFQTLCIGRKSGVCEKALTVQRTRRRVAEVANGVTDRAESTKERTTAMNYFKLMLPKTLWLGTVGVAATLLCWTPSCKAQEVSPAHFTQTGVEDVYPVEKPLAKKPAKVYIATHSIQAKPSNQAIDRKQNTHRAARKRKVVSAPSI